MASTDEQHSLNDGLAQMLQSGVIMDVSSVEEARIAEGAGACAVMALDCIPSKLRRLGGVARMSSVELIRSIKGAVSIPVMAKCRIGHEMEARVLESVGVDFIDESEVLTPADDHHIDKRGWRAPFVCGARNLGEALRRIQEGAVMIRSKGEAGTGDVSHAVKHLRQIKEEIAALQVHVLQNPGEDALGAYCAKERIRDRSLAEQTIKAGRLPVTTFAAGGIATPADAALMISRGADGVFVGSGIFESNAPAAMAASICRAVHCHSDPARLEQACATAGAAMAGTGPEHLKVKMAERG